MKKKIFLVILFIFVIVLNSFAADDPGKYGFQILKIGLSARNAGKADAVIASPGDATILWSNPAAVQISPSSNFCFNHNSYIFDNNIENASLIVRNGKSSWGLGLTYLDYGMINKTDAQGDTIGEFHPLDIVSSFTYARRITPSISLGANLKFIYEKIDTDASYGFGFDIGAIYDSFIKGLNFGMVVQNIGKSSKLKKESISFPLVFKLGSQYLWEMNAENTFTFSGEFAKYSSEGLKANLGFEYGFADMIFSRLGYKINYDEQNVTAGIGIKLNDFNFDYAFTPYQNDIGTAHRFSVAYNF
ncbi:MAG: PorV/PorQ family protein [Candidatus Cloacimonetes bacterium]|nr:PorV/PorQ family protein [Candidatus Cloacimonadota bacterium]